MVRRHQKAQAAVELAVFGAVVIFLLGTIVRTALGNSYTQSQNFKAMRMALLSSWTDSTSVPGASSYEYPSNSAGQVTAHNSASVLFIEDRLSPDFGKYGDLDRTPYMAQGGGSFSYNLLYPIDPSEVASDLPVMDVYINGVHFPFTTASYVADKALVPPPSPTYAQSACGAGTPNITPPLTVQQCVQNQCYRYYREWYWNTANGQPQAQYKLFYTLVANPGQVAAPPANTQASTPAPVFSTTAPSCPNPPCANNELYRDMPLRGYNGSLTTDGDGSATNSNAVMQYDLMRDADYSKTAPGVLSKSQFPVCGGGQCLRQYVAWQWAATAGTTAAMIGLNTSSGTYPTYDIDGRLKEVTIYSISQQGNVTHVAYQDPDGGDIDGAWDSNSCGPKPGLQQDSQIYTFTQNGTYLQIKDGQMFNPETGQFVSSVDQRNTVDLIQRTIQLSNNTGRFCEMNTPDKPCNGSETDSSGNKVICANPNPVEVCVSESNQTDNCFTQENIRQTCYDTSPGVNKIFVRSRLQNSGGRYWITNANGPLQVQR